MGIKEIDWEEVDKEHKIHIDKCSKLDKLIDEERKNQIGIDDLKKRTDLVNKFIEENNIESINLKFDIENK